jgi:aspartyl-tRNA synthetase
MCEVGDIFANSGFAAFANAVKNGSVIRAIPVKNCANQPRSFFDKMVDFATSIGAKGLAYLTWKDGEVKGPILKFLDDATVAKIVERTNAKDGDVVFFMCDEEHIASDIGGKLRVKLGQDLDLIEKGVYRFCWIVDFPMFELDRETNKIEFSHNPFSMPQGEMDALLNKNPLDILAYQYDIVVNGVELSSGAIRNHRPDIMYKAFEIAGYGKEVVEDKFGGMLNAFKLGAPPHGGIAPGVDRMVMLLTGESNIREVIAFPMNQKAQDLMMGAPAEVSQLQLRELHIKHNLPKIEQ